MTCRTRAKVALSKRLPSGQEAEHRARCPDDNHVEQAVVGLDLPARLDQRPHLSEVGDQDLGRLPAAATSVEDDLRGRALLHLTTRLSTFQPAASSLSCVSRTASPILGPGRRRPSTSARVTVLPPAPPTRSTPGCRTRSWAATAGRPGRRQ